MTTCFTASATGSHRFGALLPADIEEFHRRTRGFRHNTARSDHEGRWEDCQTCWHLSLGGAADLGAKTVGPGAITRDEALALVAGGSTSVRHRVIEGERKARAHVGLPSKADAAANTVFLKGRVRHGVESGALSSSPAIVHRVLELAIQFASDSGERVGHDEELPFGRIARGVVAPGCVVEAGDVERIWLELKAMCQTDVELARVIDQLIAGRSVHEGSVASLDVATSDPQGGNLLDHVIAEPGYGTIDHMGADPADLAVWAEEQCDAEDDLDAEAGQVLSTAVDEVLAILRRRRGTQPTTKDAADKAERKYAKQVEDATFRALVEVAGELPETWKRHPDFEELALEVRTTAELRLLRERGV